MYNPFKGHIISNGDSYRNRRYTIVGWVYQCLIAPDYWFLDRDIFTKYTTTVDIKVAIKALNTYYSPKKQWKVVSLPKEVC